MMRSDLIRMIGDGSIYKSRKWRQFRQAVLARDEYQCQECKRYGRLKQADTIHHIKHADTDPDLFFVLGNCVSVCRECHNRLHPEKAKGKMRGNLYREPSPINKSPSLQSKRGRDTLPIVCNAL